MIDCIAYRWSPGIGDPSLIGWTAAAMFVVAAVMCLMRARDGFSGLYPQTTQVRLFWLGLFFVLAALAVNKQLDLHSLITIGGRCVAVEQGWYGERQSVQRGFILGLVLAAGLAGGGVLWLMRHALRRIWLALAGFGLLVVFILISASSFHSIDVFIGLELMGVGMNRVVEITALTMIIIGARRRASDRLAPPSSPGIHEPPTNA